MGTSPPASVPQSWVGGAEVSGPCCALAAARDALLLTDGLTGWLAGWLTGWLTG